MVEFYQTQFFIVAGVAMVLLTIACIVFVMERIIRGIRSVCKEAVNDIVQEAKKEEIERTSGTEDNISSEKDPQIIPK